MGGGILRNTNKKKGFTLIELLAVIVILAIIALIATPIILNMINDAKKSAAKDSAYGYIEAIEQNNALAQMDSTKYTKIPDTITEEGISVSSINSQLKLKGTKPNDGKVKITKGLVSYADLCINGYNVSYNGTTAIVTGICNSSDEEIVLEGDPILEKAKALVYENGTCKTDGTTYNYMGGCYIKGASTNNYVWYNGFMWRIMGINSDNTVRLITDESVTTISYGASNTAEDYATNEGYINDWLNVYFYNNLNSTKSIIEKGAYFCSETTNSGYLTIDTARSTCASGKEVTAQIGIISLDEYLLASSSSSYLNIGQIFWTMTPCSTSSVLSVNYNGSAGNKGVSATYAYGVRPVINVNAISTITKGDGTASNYYVLSENKESDKTGTLGENATSGEYVKLEGKTYRVVSKESDGIKLILDGYYEVKEGTSYTMRYGNNNTFTLSSGIGQKLNGDVLKWLGLYDSNKIVETIYYQGDGISSGFKYIDALKETNGVTAQVGLIRVGEMLSNQSSTILTKNYATSSIYSNATDYWKINKYTSKSFVWHVHNYGRATEHGVDITSGVRPVIKVKANLTISKGNGTWNNPYEV